MSYILNGVVESRTIAAIPAPADIIFLHEYKFISRVASVRPNRIVVNGETKYMSLNHPFYEKQHTDKAAANLLFCDGHAKYRRKNAIKFKDFGVDTRSLTDPEQTLSTDDVIAADIEQNYRLPAAF